MEANRENIEPRNLQTSLFSLHDVNDYSDIPTRERLNFKYESYTLQCLSIFCITLSTYVTSEAIARSDRFRHFWDYDFMGRVLRYVPFKYKNLIDHDYIIELSPDGYWHFHGLIAMPAEVASKLWINGALNKQLAENLKSFEKAGKYRYFRINKFEFEPARCGKEGSVHQWIDYITKGFFIDGAA